MFMIHPAAQQNCTSVTGSASGFQPECHRTVVYKVYLHVRAELTASHATDSLLASIGEFVEKPLAHFRRSRAGKACTGTLPGIRCQRELGYQQKIKTCVQQATVHAPRIVWKNPVTYDALRKPGCVGIRIVAMYRGKNQQPAADCGNASSFTSDLGFAYSLQ